MYFGITLVSPDQEASQARHAVPAKSLQACNTTVFWAAVTANGSRFSMWASLPLNNENIAWPILLSCWFDLNYKSLSKPEKAFGSPARF